MKITCTGGGQGCLLVGPMSVTTPQAMIHLIPVIDCTLPCECKWRERRKDVLQYFTKAYNLLILLYQWLLKSSLPRVPSCYLLLYRQAVKMLAELLTLWWLKGTAGIRLTGLRCVYLFIFTLFFSEDSFQHYVSIQSSGGDNRLVEANDWLSTVCTGCQMQYQHRLVLLRTWGCLQRGCGSWFCYSADLQQIVLKWLGLSSPSWWT